MQPELWFHILPLELNIPREVPLILVVTCCQKSIFSENPISVLLQHWARKSRSLASKQRFMILRASNRYPGWNVPKKSYLGTGQKTTPMQCKKTSHPTDSSVLKALSISMPADLFSHFVWWLYFTIALPFLLSYARSLAISYSSYFLWWILSALIRRSPDLSRWVLFCSAWYHLTSRWRPIWQWSRLYRFSCLSLVQLLSCAQLATICLICSVIPGQ